MQSRRVSLSDFSDALQHDEDEIMTKLFDKLDTDQNGTLDPKEFRSFVKEVLEFDVDTAFGGEGYVKSVFDEVDLNGDGKISKSELKAYISKQVSRCATAPLVKLVDNSVVRVFRESPAFAFDSGVLHVLVLLHPNLSCRLLSSTQETPLPRKLSFMLAKPAFCTLILDMVSNTLNRANNQALLFTGTHLNHHVHHRSYEVLLIKPSTDVTEKKGTVHMKLDDKHCFKHKTGTPHTKSLDIKVSASEDVDKIFHMIDDVACKNYNGWTTPTSWWEGMLL